MADLSFEPPPPKRSGEPSTTKDEPAPYRIPDTPKRPRANDVTPPPQVEAPANAPLPRAEPPGFRAWLAKSQVAQLATTSVVFGLLMVGYLFFTSGREPAGPSLSAAPEGFPKLVIQSQDARVSEAEVQARLQAPTVARGPTDGPAAPAWRMRQGSKLAVKSAPPAQKAPGATRASSRRSAALEAVTAPSPLPEERSFPAEFFGGGVIKASGQSANSQSPSLPVGVRVAVALREGLSSSYGGVVLAQVTQSVETNGQVVLQTGDLLKGRVQSDGERIYIEFFEAATSRSTFRLSGYATDGPYPGLLADQRSPRDAS